MARFRHPFTVGMPFDSWPRVDRDAWEAATADGDLLNGRGRGADWTPKTRKSVCKGYGYWLRYLKDYRKLECVTAVGDRLTEVNLRAYIMHIRDRLAPQTVVTRLMHLNSAISAMDPTADRSLLKLAISRLSISSHPVRNKSQRLVPTTTLYALGRTLMTEWRQRQAHDPRLNAMDYRDGLMIAFLALCPLRLENLAQMRIGRHLIFAGEVVRVAFTAGEDEEQAGAGVRFPGGAAR